MKYRIAVRYGAERQRYHLFTLSAPDLVAALQEVAAALPGEVARTGDLVEIRPAVDPEERSFLDEAAEAADDSGPRLPDGEG